MRQRVTSGAAAVNQLERGLISALRAGHQAAFNEFFETYFSRLFRFVMRRADSDVELARDIVQATLIKAIRKLDSFRGEASLFTWLCAIARRELFDQRARLSVEQRRTVRLEDEPGVRASLESLEAAAELNPDSVLERGEVAEAVHTVLDSLPARYAHLLEWKYIQGLSVEQIAARLSATPIAVQSMLARARAAFRDGFASFIRDPGEPDIDPLAAVR